MLNFVTAITILAIATFVGMMVKVKIESMEEREQTEQLNNRREQLIKEMKAGTFDEEEAKAMMNELDDIMTESHWFNYNARMTKTQSGYQLTMLERNGNSLI